MEDLSLNIHHYSMPDIDISDIDPMPLIFTFKRDGKIIDSSVITLKSLLHLMQIRSRHIDDSLKEK